MDNHDIFIGRQELSHFITNELCDPREDFDLMEENETEPHSAVYYLKDNLAGNAQGLPSQYGTH